MVERPNNLNKDNLPITQLTQSIEQIFAQKPCREIESNEIDCLIELNQRLEASFPNSFSGGEIPVNREEKFFSYMTSCLKKWQADDVFKDQATLQFIARTMVGQFLKSASQRKFPSGGGEVRPMRWANDPYYLASQEVKAGDLMKELNCPEEAWKLYTRAISRVPNMKVSQFFPSFSANHNRHPIEQNV